MYRQRFTLGGPCDGAEEKDSKPTCQMRREDFWYCHEQKILVVNVISKFGRKLKKFPA
jgi:hypothetical protein